MQSSRRRRFDGPPLTQSSPPLPWTRSRSCCRQNRRVLWIELGQFSASHPRPAGHSSVACPDFGDKGTCTQRPEVSLINLIHSNGVNSIQPCRQRANRPVFAAPAEESPGVSAGWVSGTLPTLPSPAQISYHTESTLTESGMSTVTLIGNCITSCTCIVCLATPQRAQMQRTSSGHPCRRPPLRLKCQDLQRAAL